MGLRKRAKDAYDKMDPLSPEAELFAKYVDQTEKLYDMWVEGSVEAAQSYKQGGKTYTQKMLNENIEKVFSAAEKSERSDIGWQAKPSKTDPTKLDPRTVTEEDVLIILKDVHNGQYKDGTFFPVRINTPQILIDAAKNWRGDVIKNYPIVMPVWKMRQAMALSEDEVRSGKPHALTEADMISIIKKMGDPNYIIYQGENDRYALIVELETANKIKRKLPLL